jgi:UDP-glucose 4-epimerase
LIRAVTRPFWITGRLLASSSLSANFTDEDMISEVVNRYGATAIIHMAAVVGEAQTMPSEAFRVNAFGTVRLLEVAKKHGLRRFVFTSSRGVYGEQTGEHAHPI